jgi:Protein of unknown function (DUF3489)
VVAAQDAERSSNKPGRSDS